MQVSRLLGGQNKSQPVYIPVKKESKQKIPALLRKDPNPVSKKTSK